MNLLTNLYNLIQVYINIFLDKYTYKSIKLYIIKSSSHVHELVHEIHYFMNIYSLFQCDVHTLMQLM